MAIDKLTPRYLNLDDDARLIKNAEMTDALNIRVAATEEGTDGVVKNAFGNSAVAFKNGNNWQGKTHALPAGENYTISSVEDKATGQVIFFVWNSNDNHSIYRFTTASTFCELVYRDAVLNFSKNAHIQANIIRNLNNDSLLYFTDGNVSPKKINITVAINGGYSATLNTGTASEKLQFLTVARMPPLDPPVYQVRTDTAFEDNLIYNKNFQFAYQYIYNDGEVSAVSKYTDLVVGANQYLDGIINDQQELEYNYVRLTLKSSVADVKKIRVLARNGNEGSFFIIGELSNPISTTVQNLTLDFYNNSTYKYLSQDEQDKIYDAVPITAQAQTISGNRLFYGNYTEGYDNTNTAANTLVNYEDEPQTVNIPVTISYTTSSVGAPSLEDPGTDSNQPAYNNVKISFDLAGYTPSTSQSTAIINFSINLSGENNDKAVDVWGNFFPSAYHGGIFFNWVELDNDLIEKNAGGLLSYARVIVSSININKYINIPANTSTSSLLSLIESELVDVYTTSLGSDTSVAGQATRIESPKSYLDNLARRWMYMQGTASFNLTTLSSSSNSIQFSLSCTSATVTPKAIYRGDNYWSLSTGYSYNALPNNSKEVNFKSSENVTISLTGTNLGYGFTSKANDEVTPSGGSVQISYFLYSRDIPKLINSQNYIDTGNSNLKSFKAGSSHSVGLVYYDDRGRSSFVQKIKDADVKWYTDRPYQYYGAASVDLRITSNGPTWATRWAPTLRKTGQVDRFIQYTAIDAYTASNPVAENSVANVSNNDVVYVSMRSLEGKDDSFVDAKGALLNYKYQEGDRLRIVSYRDTNIAIVTFGIGTSVLVGDVYSSNGSSYRVVSVDAVGSSRKITLKRISGVTTIASSGTFIKGSIISGLFTFTDGVFYSERYVYPDVEFTVAAYTNLTNDVTSNPILNEANDDTVYNTTGWFLVLNDNDARFFNKQSIIDGESSWGKEVIVEVYSRKIPSNEDIYFEIGKSFTITNGVHSGDSRLLTSLTARVQSVTAGIQVYFTQRVYNGDIIRDDSNNRFRVTNVRSAVNVISSITYAYVVDGYIIQGGFSPGATFAGGTGLQIVNTGDAVCNLTSGDVYFRLRQLRIGKDAKTFGYLVRSVETDSVSDFYNSSNTSIGRPSAESPDAKRTIRSGSVTYSDPFVIDSYTLGLSSFNPSNANFYDLNYIHGPIRSLINRDDSVVFLQEKKVGIFPVSRNILETADGQSALTTTTDVVGSPRYYQDDLGVNNNPESVALERGRIYFTDLRAGKVVRLSQDGLTAISEAKLDSYFKGKFKDIVQFGTVKKVIGGVDLESSEYVISSDAIKLFYIKIYADGTIINPQYQYLAQTDTAGTKVYVNFEYNDSAIPTFDTENRFFSNICDDFGQSLNGIVFLDRLAEGFPLYLGTEFIGTDSNTITCIATNSNFDFYVQILVNLSDGSFTFINTCGSHDAYIQQDYGDVQPFTIAWDTEDSVWNTKYSFIPESIITVDDTLYTFKNGAMYKHHDGANRATYYGTAYSSVVEVVSGYNPSMVKAYEAISIEGTNSWDAVLTNTDQSTSISDTSVTIDGVTYPFGEYEKKERNFYAYIPRDSSANTTGFGTITNLSGSSEVYALGVVESFNVDNITFTTPIADIPFPFGADIYAASGATLIKKPYNVIGILSSDTIQTDLAVNSTSIGDNLVAISTNPSIEGDQMRDYYLKIRLSCNYTAETELYAVNAVYAKSNLHNELGQ